MSHVNDRTDAAIKAIRELAQGDLKSFAENMTGHVKDNSPKDTGHNAASVAMKVVDENTITVHTESGYGAYLELGTSKMGPRPYFMPAFEQSRSEFNPRHD